MKCEVHGVAMTAQRRGDPECTECYLEALRQMPTPHPHTIEAYFNEHHLVWVIDGKDPGKEADHGKA